MNNIKIENIVAYAQISEGINIEDLIEKIPDLQYNPEDFLGVTFKFDYPKTAILLMPSGKAICTGAISMEEVETSINKLIEKLIDVGIEVNKKPRIETQNFVVSTELNKDLDLSSISKSLLLKNVNYEPDQFPGLIYNMDEIGALLLIFSSGKIVCTGTKSFEDASKAIEMMKDMISSLGTI